MLFASRSAPHFCLSLARSGSVGAGRGSPARPRQPLHGWALCERRRWPSRQRGESNPCAHRHANDPARGERVRMPGSWARGLKVPKGPTADKRTWVPGPMYLKCGAPGQDSNRENEEPLSSEACGDHDGTWCSSLAEHPRLVHARVVIDSFAAARRMRGHPTAPELATCRYCFRCLRALDGWHRGAGPRIGDFRLRTQPITQRASQSTSARPAPADTRSATIGTPTRSAPIRWDARCTHGAAFSKSNCRRSGPASRCGRRREG